MYFTFCSVLYVLGVMRVQSLGLVEWVARFLRYYLILYKDCIKQFLEWWFHCM
jgi:hypothetical protein